jgi:hypothetical protein
MAIGDIVSDEDLNAMAPGSDVPAPAAPSGSASDFSLQPSASSDGPTFSDADIALMEEQSKAAGDINAAYAATAPASPLSGPSSPSPFASTGLGPTQPKTFSTQELDQLEADSLNDPSVDLSRDQWDSAMDARKRVGGSFWSSAVGNIAGGIGGLFQTTYGGIKDLMHTPRYQGDFGDYAQKTLEHETAVANSALQGFRNAGMQTMLGIQQVKQGWQGLVDGSADAGLVNATPEQIKAGADAGYSNYLDNNAFKREIERPTITSVPQIVSLAAPDDASGQKVEQALSASFNNPATAPLKDLTELSAIAAAPENQIAGAAGALISKVPIGNLTKYASGRVLQGLGNTTIVANDALDSAAKAAIDRVNAVIPSVKIGDKVYEGADIAAAGVVGGAGLLGWSGASNGQDGGNPLWSAMKPVLGYLALRKGAAVVRTIGQGAQVTGTILREASDVMGPLRADAIGAIASNPGIPAAYRTAAADALATGGTGAIDSTMSRVANSESYPGWVRRLASKANNPILTNASRITGSAVEGGIAGSLAMLPLTLGQDEEQAGANVGAGFGFGAVGGLASRVLGNSARQRNQDIARFLADTQLAGGDVTRVAQLPAGRLQNLAAIQGLLGMKGTDVIPVGAAEFDKQVGAALSNQPGIAPADVVPLDGTDFTANVAALGGRGGAGWFVDGTPGERPRVFINLDAEHPAEIHEGLGHAILASNVMDGAQRSDARNFIQQLYGDAGIEARAREYAQRQVEAEEASLRQRAAVAGQPLPTFPPLEERITQRVQQLSDNGLAAGNEHPLDWARDEVFAEQMNQAGVDVNSIRKGLPANVDPDAATRSMLAMNARSLAAQGVSIDPQTGKVNGSLSSIFRDNPLVGSSPTLSKQLARYVSSYDSWLNGIDLGAKRVEGTQIAASGSPYDMARSNLVNLRPVPGRPGVFENDFLRNDNGTVTFKSQDEIRRTDQLRKDQLSAAIGTGLRPKNDPVLGPRMVDGKRVISGSQLPATMGALQHFGPWIQSIANTFKSDAGQGGVYRMKVNRVGTGETGAYKVINLGNIRSITRNFWEPFEYSVSSQGHLLAHTIDDSAVQRNVLKGINEGLLPHHNNDAAAVHQSLMTYLSNHKQGLPSENAIGIGKRNEINALLTSFSKNHRNINPLAANFGPQGVVRRIRMDRIEDMNRVTDTDKGSPTYGQPLQGFHFDYFKVNNNMMPDVGGSKSGPVYAPEVGPKSGFTPSMSAGDWAKAWQKTLGIKRAKPQELRDHKLWVIDSLRKLAIDQGWNYGWKQDPAHTGAYPWVMYVDSPVGQISFHSRSPDTSINPEISKAAEDVSREKQAMFSQIDARQFPDLKVSPLAAESLSTKNFQPGSTAADVRERLLEGITVQDLLWHKIDSGGVMKSVLYKLNNGWDAIPELRNDPIVMKIRDYQHALSSIDVNPYLLASKRFTGLNKSVVSKIYEGDWDQSKGTQLQRLEKLQEMFPTHLMP